MTEEVTFGSVCSGIEAASVAFAPLGWRAAWFSEIEAFPSAVLAHHYPEVQNLGDMRALPEAILSGAAVAPDVLCGGTPCQAFSVAGRRESLSDARGNLSLTFCDIANAIDSVRLVRGDEPCVILWENVPGVLSTGDNAFGCFLAGLAGDGEPLVPEPCPPAGKSSRHWKWSKAAGHHSLSWSVAGCVIGPSRTVAWRVIDAQYFGLAQRRRRVFVVASARKGFDPAAVLFEWQGVRRDSAPGREAGQSVAENSARGVALSEQEVGSPAELGDDGGDKPHALAFGGNNTAGSIDVATARNACASGRLDFESETFITCAVPNVAMTLRARHNANTNEDAMGGGLLPVLPFDTTQVTSVANRSNPKPGDPCHPLAAGAHPPAIAFPANLSATQHASAEDLAPAMGEKNPTAVAYSVRLANTSSNGWGVQEDVTHALDCTAGPAVHSAMHVRRLMPEECETLQGFRKGYTAIPWRGKLAGECPDGPRYKAIGNSWAVPCVTWLGRKIDKALR